MLRLTTLLRLATLTALAGCATAPANNGIQMTSQEAQACAAEGCTVWTEQELRNLVMVIVQRTREKCRREDI